MVNVVDFYLDDNKPKDVQALASKSTMGPQDDALMQGFVLEALRKCSDVLLLSGMI